MVDFRITHTPCIGAVGNAHRMIQNQNQINGMKPVWASPGINRGVYAANPRNTVKSALESSEVQDNLASGKGELTRENRGWISNPSGY